MITLDAKTETRLNLAWAHNLYEIGSLLETDVRQIAQRAQAARVRCEQELTALLAEADVVEAQIALLWTPEEIAAARRGVTLIRDLEVEGMATLSPALLA